MNQSRYEEWSIPQLRIYAVKIGVLNLSSLVEKNELVTAIVNRERLRVKPLSTGAKRPYSPSNVNPTLNKTFSAPITPIYSVKTSRSSSLKGISSVRDHPFKNMSLVQMEEEFTKMYDKNLEAMFKIKTLPHWINRPKTIKHLVKCLTTKDPLWHFFGNPPLASINKNIQNSPRNINPYIYYGTLDDYQSYSLVELESSFINDMFETSKTRFFVPGKDNKEEFDILSIRQLRNFLDDLEEDSICIFSSLISKLDNCLINDPQIISYIQDVSKTYLSLPDESQRNIEELSLLLFLSGIYPQNEKFKYPDITSVTSNIVYINNEITSRLKSLQDEEKNMISKILIVDYNFSLRSIKEMKNERFMNYYSKEIDYTKNYSLDAIKTFYSVFVHVFMWNDNIINKKLSNYIGKRVIFIERGQ